MTPMDDVAPINIDGGPRRYVSRWEEPNEEHPVIEELKRRREALEAGEDTGSPWGVIQEDLKIGLMGANVNEAFIACRNESRIAISCPWTTAYAKWRTDAEQEAFEDAEYAKAMETLTAKPAGENAA